MKKILLLIMCFCMALALTGCSEAKEEVLDGESEVIEEDMDEDVSSKILVVCFSRTGNTKALAEYAVEYLKADAYEIVAAEEYSDEDINYGNSNSRTSIEQNDKSARPEIEGLITNISEYDTIVLGYPIWWGQAPRIIDTFMESFDFSGKTIIPFCTSASSGIGSSDTYLHELVSDDVNWAQRKRFPAGTSKEEFTNWLSNTLNKGS